MPATIKGGFFEANGVVSLTTIESTSAARRRISQLLGQKGQAGLRELMLTLNGVAAGQAALATRSRIAASEELGGARTIETETFVDRVSAAADVTDIAADLLSLSSKTYDGTPIANGDGNPLGTR